MRLRLASVLALLAMAGTAQAANIFNITGPAPFGFGNQIVIVQAWSQTTIYTGVSIVMPMADLTAGGPIGGVEGTVYLMKRIGPGTTAADEVAPPVSISGLTALFTNQTLFSGLTLSSGNYYLVINSTSINSLSASPEGSSSAVVTPGVGVAALGGASALVAAPYAPASSLSLNPPGNLFITVTGNFVGSGVVPTLSTVGLAALLVGLAGAALFLLRQRTA
jgi:hypothetical protein